MRHAVAGHVTARVYKKMLADSFRNHEDNMRYWRHDSTTRIQSMNKWVDSLEALYNNIRREFGMPQKNYASSGQLTWVNYDISSAEKDAFRQWDVHDGDVWMGLASYVAAGYKVTMTKVKVTNSYTATMIASDDVGVNKGCAVSAFASDLYVASRLLLFKVNVLLPEDWSAFRPAPSEDFG